MNSSQRKATSVTRKIFICSDSTEDIAHVRKMAVTSGEELATLSMDGHTVHFDGEQDQGRDRVNTKYLIPKGVTFSKALNQIDRQEGLAEVRGLMREIMNGKTMIVRFIALGPTNSAFTLLGIQCTDSWYVAHTEDLLYRPDMSNSLRPVQKRFFTCHSLSRKTKQ